MKREGAPGQSQFREPAEPFGPFAKEVNGIREEKDLPRSRDKREIRQSAPLRRAGGAAAGRVGAGSQHSG